MVLPKNWAMMVASGGALVRQGFQYRFVDNSGQAHHVFPPSERSGKGKLSGRGTEDVPLSLAQGISSSQAVSSGVVGAGFQPQGSGGEPSVCVSQRKVYSFVSVYVSQRKGESSSGPGGGKASLPLGSGGISSLFSASSRAPNFPFNSGVGTLFGDNAVKPSFQDVSVLVLLRLLMLLCRLKLLCRLRLLSLLKLLCRLKLLSLLKLLCLLRLLGLFKLFCLLTFQRRVLIRSYLYGVRACLPCVSPLEVMLESLQVEDRFKSSCLLCRLVWCLLCRLRI